MLLSMRLKLHGNRPLDKHTLTISRIKIIVNATCSLLDEVVTKIHGGIKEMCPL